MMNYIEAASISMISMNRLKGIELADTDVVISRVPPPTSGQMPFGDRDVLIAAGGRAGRAALADPRRMGMTRG